MTATAGPQTSERREVEEDLNDNAQLREVSEVRDGLGDALVDGLNQIDQSKRGDILAWSEASATT